MSISIHVQIHRFIHTWDFICSLSTSPVYPCFHSNATRPPKHTHTHVCLGTGFDEVLMETQISRVRKYMSKSRPHSDVLFVRFFQYINSCCPRWHIWLRCPLSKSDPQAQMTLLAYTPLVRECPPSIKSLINQKHLAIYVVYSAKTIILNLVDHHEPNSSVKRKFPNWNQDTNICLSLYPWTCTQVHVWLNVSLLFVPLLYHMLYFCLFFFF